MVLSKIKKIACILMAVYAVAIFVMGTVSVIESFTTPAYAQTITNTNQQVNTLGPFEKIGRVLLGLFYNVRNFLYIAAAFTLLYMVYNDWATKGTIDWQKLLYVIVGLALMAGIGFFLEGVVGTNATGNNGFIPASTIQVN